MCHCKWKAANYISQKNAAQKKKKALNLNAIWKWQQLCISMKTARIAQITTAQFKWWWPNKVSPPQLNWNSGFYSSQYMLKTSKRVLQADIPPPCPPPIFMSLTRSAHRQAFMLEIEIQNYLHPPLLRGGFKRRTKRCDRHCREILHELKLIQGLITVKTGLHERRLLSSLTETRAWREREKKKLHHLSFYIYKLRNLQWERGK